MNYVRMGGIIRLRRMARGMTQAQLAQAVGIQASFMGHIERGGRKPSLETIYKICEVLNMSMDRLFERVPEESPALMECVAKILALALDTAQTTLYETSTCIEEEMN